MPPFFMGTAMDIPSGLSQSRQLLFSVLTNLIFSINLVIAFCLLLFILSMYLIHKYIECLNLYQIQLL